MNKDFYSRIIGGFIAKSESNKFNKIFTFVENKEFKDVIQHKFVHYLDFSLHFHEINKIKDYDENAYREWRNITDWWTEGLPVFSSKIYKVMKYNNGKEDQMFNDIYSNTPIIYARIHAFLNSNEELKNIRTEMLEAIKNKNKDRYYKVIHNLTDNYGKKYLSWLKEL